MTSTPRPSMPGPMQSESAEQSLLGRGLALAIVAAAIVVALFAFRSVSNDSTSGASATSSVTTAGVTDTTVADDTDVVDDAAAEPEIEPPPVLGTEAELVQLDGWLQSDISSLGDLDGQVHIVQFWTFGCYNCKNTLPTLIDINEKYGGDDFSIVGVHAPEFEREKDPDSILAAAEQLGVTWPIALDTKKKNFRSWQGDRRFWPRTYVIDQEGNIRFDRIGEGAYEKLEQTVAYLLENGPGTTAQ